MNPVKYLHFLEYSSNKDDLQKIIDQRHLVFSHSVSRENTDILMRKNVEYSLEGMYRVQLAFLNDVQRLVSK